MYALRLPICLILLLLSCAAGATHIVGGNLHYEYLGNDQYLIELKVYRDCATSSTDFDDPAAIGVFDINGNLVMNVEIPLEDAIITDVPVNTGNACLEAPAGICVKEAIFSATVTLPPIAGGYTLAYQRCCRNTTLVNTESNDDLGITLYAEIPGPEVAAINSNPFFNEYPPVIICMNQPFVFDHSATDPDGDQLVYEFCNPLLTNVPGFYINPPGAPEYPELIFNPGYSADYPIASAPAFAIDPNTGLLTGTPNQLGQYVVGICVHEYRNGELISTTNRDFQFNVAVCDIDVVAAIPEQTNFCDGLEVFFGNNSENATSYLWDFGVDEGAGDQSTEEEPTFVFPDTGLYVITLIANPGTICADTAVSTYSAFPVILPEVSVGAGICIDGAMYYEFSGIANADEDATWSWDFGPGASPSESNEASPGPVSLNAGTHEITLTISDNGCVETATMELIQPPDPIASIVPQGSFCDGYTYTFETDSQNATTYNWDFGVPGNEDELEGESPVFTFPGPGEYIITLVASAPNTCPDQTTDVFGIYGDLAPYFSDPGSQCLDGNSFDFTGMGASTDFADYAWTFEGPADVNASDDPNVFGVSWMNTGTFAVSLTISENGCTETYTDSVWIAADPVIGFSTEGAIGCAPLTVGFENTSEGETPLMYVWDFGNGSLSTSSNPTHIYDEPGTYDVTLTATSMEGCVATLTLTFDNIVTVYGPPIPGFVIDNQNLDILDPFVQVSSTAQGAVDCFYVTSDGAVYEDCDFGHAFTEAGRQWITQTVINEYGCVASITGYINIGGFIFFAPNAFTPNNDGINDVWIPELTGVTSYRLSIYNRWGETIFETDDPTIPWQGQVRDGQYFVPDGVYEWRVVVHDLLGYPHDFAGHINLLR